MDIVDVILSTVVIMLMLNPLITLGTLEHDSANIQIFDINMQPNDYVNNFFFLTMTWINKGYLNTSYFYDVKYVEPWYVIDARNLFFRNIIDEIKNNEYKKAEWFDLYDFIMNNDPIPLDKLNDIILKRIEALDDRTMIIMYGHGFHAGHTDLLTYLGLDDTVLPYYGGRTSEDWSKYLQKHWRYYYLTSKDIHKIFEDRKPYLIPPLVYIIACNSGRYNGNGSWRWAFKLDDQNTYEEWSNRAFIGAYKEIPVDPTYALWDELLHYIVFSQINGEERNSWDSFRHYIRTLNEIYGYSIGYYAIIQKYENGEYTRTVKKFAVNSKEVYTYYGDVNTIIDPTLRDQIIKYTKEYLNRYLGSLFNNYLVNYITNISVEEGWSDQVYDRYMVRIHLDSRFFKKYTYIDVYLYRHKGTSELFGNGASISLYIPEELKDVFIAYVKENYINKSFANDAGLLERYGLKVVLESNTYMHDEQYYSAFENLYYDILLDDVSVRNSIHGLGIPHMSFMLDYDVNQRYFSLSLYTGYESVINALQYGFKINPWNIDRKELARILEEHQIPIDNATITRYYVVDKEAIRPIYYVVYPVKISCIGYLCVNYTYVNASLVVYADNGEIINLYTPQNPIPGPELQYTGNLTTDQSGIVESSGKNNNEQTYIGSSSSNNLFKTNKSDSRTVYNDTVDHTIDNRYNLPVIIGVILPVVLVLTVFLKRRSK